MIKENCGIDYGMGNTNIDKDNGIRYGVINQGEVLQAWADSSEPEYVYSCPHCGEELNYENEDYPKLPQNCKSCGKEVDDNDLMDIEPIGFYLDDGEYKAEQNRDDCDIFITKSPYYSYAQFCSPCAPGAGYLMTELNGKPKGNRTYCFGHDWFDNGKAPYRVFRVSDNKEVLPND